MKRSALALGVYLQIAGAAANGALIVIDDFEAGSFNVTYNSALDGNTPAVAEQAGLDPASVAGGVRLVQLFGDTGELGPTVITATLTPTPVDDAAQALVLPGGLGADFILIYDGVAGGNANSGLQGNLGLDLSGNPSIRLDAEAMPVEGHDIEVRLRLWDSSKTQVVSKTLVTGGNHFALADFTTLDLSDIRSMQVNVVDLQGGETVSLLQLLSVPEPVSALLLSMGLVGLAALRPPRRAS